MTWTTDKIRMRCTFCDETGTALAARHSISIDYACSIKAGLNRRDYTQPFAALG
jgi:hypothetical protein